MKRMLSLVTFLLTSYVAVVAQPLKTLPHQADEYLRSAKAAYRFNGVALMAHRGEVILHKAYGFAQVSRSTPNDTSTRFPILSVTKSFTSALVLKLQEQGKLSVEDKLSKYLPDFPHSHQIKLHHLMNHTSGLFNYTELIDEEDSTIVCHPISRQLFFDLMQHKPLAFTPGKQFSYNNSGYFLLGLVIEQATGKPYEQAMRELIFQPLGMNHSGFDYLNLPAGARAFGYDTLTSTHVSAYPHPDSTVLYAAGGIYSTARDLFQWARAVATKQLLAEKTWKQAFKEGYGWQTGTYENKGYVRHSGGYPGFMAEFIYYPTEDLTIILLNNFGTYTDSIFPVVMDLSSMAFGKPYDLWQERKEVELSQNELESYVGTYRLNKKYAIDIVVRQGRLYALGHTSGQMPELALHATSPGHFFVWTFNNYVTFKKKASGEVSGFVLREHGKDSTWEKVK
ncbi:hypothetical protein BWI97_24180 [Siphonobacter sp. BAB-5405]|uniref:serine hydrolase n=1 Tax=Siphonobacter sp. BAB-5405 TaxID=1864825 RepID=UPI000C7F9349|nr:serine hydrolase [Siphonobacter sp. BAB-5405]PMD90208.1 hypothetical protein BWI97_24180 [Siphonobacter sp. BAB-5405]